MKTPEVYSVWSFVVVSELHIEAQQHRGEDEVTHYDHWGGSGGSLVNPNT